ncbi:hypothetical protein [Deinococcus humi]|uniref:Uncharacterized protein n=1 Tax=Deinococcus humi TaxID=662880 RepID=A0A7W8JWW7_9DEIO|nr:hypothetical protein [Deinococcus humi]MBB5363423.1 hypothetical protein [Deinococcus humi]GGO26608.1 hypothetical protein GCM10008949_17480 [Deinococcus humi]
MTWLTALTAGLAFAVALVEVRLDSVYPMALALGLAGLVAYGLFRRVEDVRMVLE